MGFLENIFVGIFDNAAWDALKKFFGKKPATGAFVRARGYIKNLRMTNNKAYGLGEFLELEKGGEDIVMEDNLHVRE
jgi:hypothetical protein